MIKGDDCDCVCGEDNSAKRISREICSKCNVCDLSGTLEIFKEFNEVYKERLKKTEEAGGDVSQLKMKTLEDWVADLTEQNMVLVETVEALEKEALYRLELGMSAQRCSDLDVKGDSSCARLYGGFKKDLKAHRKVFHDNDKQKAPVVHTGHEHGGKDCKACKARGPEGRGYTASHSPSGGELNRLQEHQVEELQEKLHKAEEEIVHLKKNLAENELKLEKINEEIKASEKSAREMRAALTAEVADKHDQVLSLRRDVQHLEEKLRQADMQTHFKDDIIKELRKEIKVANSKLNYLGLDVVPSSCKSSKVLRPNSSVIPDRKNKMQEVVSTSWNPSPSNVIIPSWPANNHDNNFVTCVDSSLNKNNNNKIEKFPSQHSLVLKQATSSCIRYEDNRMAEISNETNYKNAVHSNNEIHVKSKREQQTKKLSKKTNVKSPSPEEKNMLEYSCGDCGT